MQTITFHIAAPDGHDNTVCVPVQGVQVNLWFGVSRVEAGSPWKVYLFSKGLAAGEGFNKRTDAVRYAELLARLGDWGQVRVGDRFDTHKELLIRGLRLRKIIRADGWTKAEEYVTQHEASQVKPPAISN